MTLGSVRGTVAAGNNRVTTTHYVLASQPYLIYFTSTVGWIYSAHNFQKGQSLD